jgi:Methylase involved in ubiquinone/menaquinone biosynthesis
VSRSSLPLPPVELAARVGSSEGADPLEFYTAEGARLRGVIESLLPKDWEWKNKHVLDFGCGSARVLRHFEHEAQGGRFWGCDIDQPSIEWGESKLNPPFRFFVNGLLPPLPLPDHALDLIWAMSVFTHIADQWAAWLLEMHRLLGPGGVLIASFLGEGMWTPLVGEPYVDDEVGMTVLHHWEGPDAWVFHSEWWLREHWGRAYEVLAVQDPPRGPDGTPQITHSYIALRRRAVKVTSAELERAAPIPRELAALQTSLRLARREMADLHQQSAPDRTVGFRRRKLSVRRLRRET